MKIWELISNILHVKSHEFCLSHRFLSCRKQYAFSLCARRRCDESPRGRATCRAWSWMGDVTTSGSEIRMPMGRSRSKKYSTRWWQVKYFSCSPSLGKWSNLTSIVFKGVETTNRSKFSEILPTFGRIELPRMCVGAFWKTMCLLPSRCLPMRKLLSLLNSFNFFWGFGLILLIWHLFLLVVGTKLTSKRSPVFFEDFFWGRFSLAGIVRPQLRSDAAWTRHDC